MNDTRQPEITVDWLNEQLRRTAYYENAIIAGVDLRPLLDLAMQSERFALSGLTYLAKMCEQQDVELSSDAIQLLLMLAKQAKLKRKLSLLH
jgi:hypothetical protein